MVLGNWDEVIQMYKDNYLESKYSYHAQAMIDLIPSIRSLSEFDGIIAGTSHGTLFFRVAEKIESVNVWYSEDGIYSVYLEHPMKGELNKVTATNENILPTLLNFIKQLESTDDNV